MQKDRVIVRAVRVRVLKHYTTGYAKSGVYPVTHHWFYEVIGDNGAVYTVSTTKEIRDGYSFTASVIGSTIYKGIEQTKLTRVSYTDETINRRVKGWIDGIVAWAKAE